MFFVRLEKIINRHEFSRIAMKTKLLYKTESYKIIVKIKAIESLTSNHIKQTLNYLAASKLKLGLLVNFGEESLSYKRIIL